MLNIINFFKKTKNLFKVIINIQLSFYCVDKAHTKKILKIRHTNRYEIYDMREHNQAQFPKNCGHYISLIKGLDNISLKYQKSSPFANHSIIVEDDDSFHIHRKNVEGMIYNIVQTYVLPKNKGKGWRNFS